MLLSLFEVYRARILPQALQQSLGLRGLTTLSIDPLRGQAWRGSHTPLFRGILGTGGWGSPQKGSGWTLGVLTTLCDVVHTAVHNHWDV